MGMQAHPPFNFTKPYELRDQLFEYACAIVRVAQVLHTQGEIGRSLGNQILRAGNSAGANYEEADDGSSKADTLGKRRITLRELKEALFRLRAVRASGLLGPEYDPVIRETLELKLIVASLVRKAEAKRRAQRGSS